MNRSQPIFSPKTSQHNYIAYQLKFQADAKGFRTLFYSLSDPSQLYRRRGFHWKCRLKNRNDNKVSNAGQNRPFKHQTLLRAPYRGSSCRLQDPQIPREGFCSYHHHYPPWDQAGKRKREYFQILGRFVSATKYLRHQHSAYISGLTIHPSIN